MTLAPGLAPWLETLSDADEAIAQEAALGLRFLIEKHVCTGPDTWLADVNAFLILRPELAARGLVALHDMALSAPEVDALAGAVWQRLLAGDGPAWRHAYVLKHAVGLPVLADDVAAYLETRWRDDEAVTLHLMFGSFEHAVCMRLLPVFDVMAGAAQTPQLRDLAEGHARVTREIDAYRAEHGHPTEEQG